VIGAGETLSTGESADDASGGPGYRQHGSPVLGPEP